MQSCSKPTGLAASFCYGVHGGGASRLFGRGTAAEREDSGAQTLALSPGPSYAVTHGTRIYGFVQLPVYQYVNGVQLTADVAYVAGVTTAF